MKKHLIIILSFVFFLPTIAISASTNNKDIPYGSLNDEKLDIYKPLKTGKNAPVIIYVHGGGWTIGDKSRVHNKAKAFNKEGYIFVSVEYPKLPNHPVEQQAKSVAQAFSWIEKNIYKYGGNSKSLTLMGHSSGAHIVALVSTDPAYLKEYNSSSKNINAVIHLDGAALHVPNHMKHTRENSKNAQTYDNAFGKDKERWNKLSPYVQLEENGYAPPFILFTTGRASSKYDSKHFVTLLKKENIQYAYKDMPNRSHASLNKKFGKSKDEEAFRLTIDFLKSLR